MDLSPRSEAENLGVCWTRFCRRLSPNKAWQLYNTVAVPTFTYTSNIWFIPPFKLMHHQNSWGSVTDTRFFLLLQGQATCFITGGLNSTTYNVLEALTNLLPVDLLFKTQMNMITHICTLPAKHPLSPLAQYALSIDTVHLYTTSSRPPYSTQKPLNISHQHIDIPFIRNPPKKWQGYI